MGFVELAKLTIIICALQIATVDSVDYCNLESCIERNLKHIHCKSNPDEICPDFISRKITPAERTGILENLNAFRQLVARGDEKRGNPGPELVAKHMPNLTWDYELELLAQTEINQCSFPLDVCRNTELYRVTRLSGKCNRLSINALDFNCIRDILIMWQNFVKFSNKSDILCFRGNLVHANMVSDRTTKVGCALRAKHITTSSHWLRISCNFAPALAVSQPVYETPHWSSNPSNKCTDYEWSGLLDTQKEAIVDLHNRFRQLVARGEETRGNPGPQPAAKNMPDMTWDNELESLAQRWSDQCTFQYDDCRDVDRFKVAQNIAMMTSHINNPDTIISVMIKNWYSTVQYFNKSEVAKYTEKDPKSAFYARMVRATSTKIGCGLTKYFSHYKHAYNFVCNYGPADKVVNEPLYETYPEEIDLDKLF